MFFFSLTRGYTHTHTHTHTHKGKKNTPLAPKKKDTTPAPKKPLAPTIIVDSIVVVAIILTFVSLASVLWRNNKNQQHTVGVADSSDSSRLHDYLLPYIGISGDEERFEDMIWQPDSSAVVAPPPRGSILPHDDVGDEEPLGDHICQPDSSEDVITFDKVEE